MLPSKEAQEYHRLTHWSFAAWCKICVNARAKDLDHKQLDETVKSSKVATVQIDYFFGKPRKMKS